MAYVRKKKVGKYEYYQLVEGKRVDGTMIGERLRG